MKSAGQKILLTGGTGMVGKNITARAPEGYKLLTPSREELNLIDAKECRQYIRKHQPDLIIHAAGIVGGIQANMKYPVKFLVQNTDMARNLIMTAAEEGIKKLINLGSSCMYPKDYQNPLKEEYLFADKLEPTNEGYALAKLYAQRLCNYISYENKELKYKTLIPCNLYGKYDKFDPLYSHMIPSVIRRMHEAKQHNAENITIWGDGTARREFMYATDLGDFIWFAIENYNKIYDTMNVGLGHDYSMNDYYHTIAEIVGFKGEFIHDKDKPVGMKQKLVDTTLQNKLGWEPKTTLEEGIQRTYQFFLNNHAR